MKMVTRTIVATKATALCLDLVKAEPFNQTILLTGNYAKVEKDGDQEKKVFDNAKVLRAFKKQFDNEQHTACSIVSVETVETIYGLSEEKFLELAVELDPETRKPVPVEANNEQ